MSNIVKLNQKLWKFGVSYLLQILPITSSSSIIQLINWLADSFFSLTCCLRFNASLWNFFNTARARPIYSGGVPAFFSLVMRVIPAYIPGRRPARSPCPWPGHRTGAWRFFGNGRYTGCCGRPSQRRWLQRRMSSPASRMRWR